MPREATRTPANYRLMSWLAAGLLLSMVATAGPLTLRGDQGPGLRPVFEYVVDERGAYTLDQVQHLPASAFRTSGRDGAALGFLQGAVWLRFDVFNQSGPETTWLLQFTDALLDDIRVYQQSAAGSWYETRLGDRQPLARDAVD